MSLVGIEAALGLAGPDAERFPVPGALVAIGPASTVVVAEPGDDPEAGGVWNAEEFRLLGPAPASITARLMGPDPFGVPNAPPEPPVHLFVRLGDDCLGIGAGQVSMCDTSDGELLSCHLRISPPLSRAVLDTVRPPTPPPPLAAPDWVDDVRRAPGRALERFATDWYLATAAPEPPADPPSSLPRSLADFHRLAAHRPALLGSQNRLLPVGGLRPDESAARLVFGIESQGGRTWSIPWNPGSRDADPVVWCEDADLVPEEEPLSSFLLQFTLEEATLAAPYQALCTNLPTRLLPSLESGLRRVPLRPFLAPAGAPTTFLVAAGLVARTGPGWEEGSTEVHLGARHRSALRPFAPLDIAWQRFDG
ncbi:MULTISPECIES: hypothetical protein [Streptomyces]|uniref:Suppressor of fused domain protein n=1 Tax=Streptomyces koyangensis TaxID=188770 RepID=A0A385DB40_9ACTN|nr:hypothetical protein [Streptomyces koyangensis]AXQ55653.1 hypothetical protein D0C37_14245 [Streptomyces koyangensis]WTD04406.1 hypothetical protein OH717_18415 [Streptomyces albidoflavus]